LPPIFSVGPGSAFYSPYWQIIRFTVPDGTAADAYTSARDVVDSGLGLRRGEGQILTLAPDAVVLPDTTRAIARPALTQGWLDGQPISFLNLGVGTFTWGADRVVDETPLFVFVMKNSDGKLQALDVPSVGGLGPVFDEKLTVPIDPVNKPLYGALWRVYTVELPTTARAFVPAAYSDIGPLLAAKHLPVDAPYADVFAATPDDAAHATYDPFVGRVAATPSCFADPAQIDMDSACNWIDGERVIERTIDPSPIKRTRLLITCPFVSYRDGAVTP